MQEADDKVNLLLVDDDPKALIALEAVLEGPDRNIVKAQSGREALRQVLGADFAVILLDVQMGDLSGFETASLIRERERSRSTPIIFLTAAMKSDASVFQGYSMGAVDYLFKPIVPEILRSKVAVFVELARMSAQLKSLNERLRDQAAQLAATNRELETFSYSVSHDLRQPIRHIREFGRALTEECAQTLPPVGREHLARIDTAAGRMSQLIEDLLALARVAQCEIHKIPVDLGSMAESIAAELRKGAPKREVEFWIAQPLWVQGDSRLLRIAMENLLANSWKYTRNHARATIEVGSMKGEDGGEIYFVRDDGAGFDPVHGDKLFAPFRRLHSEKEFEGNGVGLATTQRIVHRHGGRIWAEGAPEQGATFFFTLR